ncbi:restriction endonuclease [Variovorax sp. LARHSF232]
MARRKKTGTFDDLIELVSMFPWWAGVLLAPITFVLARAWAAHQQAAMAASPSAASGILYMLATLAQYAVPLACVLGACVSALRRHRRTTLADNVAAAAAADALQGMSWREFELLVGEGFRQKGYQVEELGGAGADGGVDLVLRKAREKYLVQCKQWRAHRVGVIVVRELYGLMAAVGAAGGFVVTSGRFTPEARAFAKGRNVELLDGDALFELIRAGRRGAAAVFPTVRPGEELVATTEVTAPVCPRCLGPMVRRVARKGANVGEAFWGCAVFPKCRGTM